MAMENASKSLMCTSMSHGYEDIRTAHASDNTGIEQREVPRLNADTLYIQHSRLMKDFLAAMSIRIQPQREPASPRSDMWIVSVSPESHNTGLIQEKDWFFGTTHRVDEVMENSILAWSHPWKRRVTKTDSKEDVIALIRRFGLESTANRLTYLDELADDDPDEEHFGLESLRWFAVFVLDRHLPPPKIGISPGGLVHAVWWVPDGILSMDFLPSGKVRFAAVLRDGEWSARGVLPLCHVMEKIELFKREMY